MKTVEINLFPSINTHKNNTQNEFYNFNSVVEDIRSSFIRSSRINHTSFSCLFENNKEKRYRYERLNEGVFIKFIKKNNTLLIVDTNKNKEVTITKDINLDYIGIENIIKSIHKNEVT